MSTGRTMPAPEAVRLELKQKAKDLMDNHRHGKPNLGQEIERALVNAWKAGRDAAESGEAYAAPVIPEAADAPTHAAKLGKNRIRDLPVWDRGLSPGRDQPGKEPVLVVQRSDDHQGKELVHVRARRRLRLG